MHTRTDIVPHQSTNHEAFRGTAIHFYTKPFRGKTQQRLDLGEARFGGSAGGSAIFPVEVWGVVRWGAAARAPLGWKLQKASRRSLGENWFGGSCTFAIVMGNAFRGSAGGSAGDPRGIRRRFGGSAPISHAFGFFGGGGGNPSW